MDLSASMIVDKRAPPQTTAFRTRHPSVWVPDSRATACYSCKAVFSMIRRKHHCRICGRIFCYSCSNHYHKPVSYLNKGDAQVKLCASCFINQKEANDVEQYILALAGMPLTMKEKWVCRLVSKKWSKAWTHFSEIRLIQYKVPYKAYNKLESLWLQTHSYELDQHNRLMIAHANFANRLPTRQIRRTPCKYLMCSSQCSGELGERERLELVTQGIHIEAAETPQWMAPWIVMNDLTSVAAKPSIEYIMEARVYGKIKLYQYTLAQLSPEDKRLWYKLCRLFATINKLVQYKEKEERKNIKRKLMDENIILNYPLDERIIIDIDVDNIVDIDSNTKPVIIPFTLSDNTVKNILVKNEDIRNDRLAQVTLMWISRLTGIEVTTYSVIPTSNTAGWIEILEDCTTLYDIKYNRETTIIDYIMENNPNETAHAIKQKFIKSVAISCVLSYILGLGDRHLENILVTGAGELLHIDYTFLFGSDPHGVPPEMRITRQTLEALGGVQSRSFKIFSNQCEEIYTKIRRAAPLWYALFKHKGESMAHKWVGERLIPGEFDTARATRIVDIVHRNSSTSWVQHILDTSRLVRKTITKQFKNREAT